MDEALSELASTPDLARMAAANESRGQYWESRFSALLESGAVRLPVSPGAEISLQPVRGDSAVPLPRVMTSLCAQVLAALRAGCHVCIDLNRLADIETDISGHIESYLVDGIPRSWLRARRVCFSICANHPALNAVLSLRRSEKLYRPSVLVRFGADAGFAQHPNWMALIADSHADPGIMPLPAMAARPLSGLHSIERGQGAMPVSLFEIPADTAWLVLEIDAQRLPAPPNVRTQLATCLRFADNLIEVTSWHRPALGLDATLNRRVAFHIAGIGDMLLRARRDPTSARTFSELNRWLLFVRRCFVHESVRLARWRGPFPELGVNELVATLAPHYGARNARRLVAHRSMRHRHLLALSPLSMLPVGVASAQLTNWLNLIPAIACADTLCMRGPDPRPRLPPDLWARLLQMTGALSSGAAISSESFTLYS